MATESQPSLNTHPSSCGVTSNIHEAGKINIRYYYVIMTKV